VHNCTTFLACYKTWLKSEQTFVEDLSDLLSNQSDAVAFIQAAIESSNDERFSNFVSTEESVYC